MNVAEAASRINMSAASRKMRREFPEKRVIIPTRGLTLARFEDPFLSSEDFLLIGHQHKTNLDKQTFQALCSLSDIKLLSHLF